MFKTGSDNRLTEREAKKWAIAHGKKVPSIATLERWEFNGTCKTPDGCTVEPDGHCPHGFPSWLLIEGFI
jgi:hypothetical protein